MAADRTFATKTEADRYLASVELSLVGGHWVDERRGRVTVGEWAGRWMASATHLKPKTAASYASLVRCLIVPKLGAVPVGELRPMQVREWVAQLTRTGLSPSRVRQAYRLLSQMLSAAQLDGMIAVSPCVGVRLPSVPEHEPTIVTAGRVTELARVMPPADGLFVLTLAYTGLRFGEGAGLQRRYVDAPGRRLTVALSLSDADGVLSLEQPKTHQHRGVTLPAFLADALAEHLDERVEPGLDAPLFTSPGGMPLRHGNFLRRVWRPAVGRVGLEGLTPHDLRASHASWLYDQGWSPVEIAARLGHAKATVTTKHYARRIAGRDVEIAAGLDALHQKSPE